jgi:predicted transcriptional regulator
MTCDCIERYPHPHPETVGQCVPFVQLCALHECIARARAKDAENKLRAHIVGWIRHVVAVAGPTSTEESAATARAIADCIENGEDWPR